MSGAPGVPSEGQETMRRSQQLRTLGGSLTARMLALVLVVALVPLIALAVLLMRDGNEALERSALGSLEASAQDSAALLTTRLGATASGVALLAGSNVLHEGSQADQQALVDGLATQWQADDVAVFDSEGNLIAGSLGGYANVAETRAFQETLALQSGQVAAPLGWDEALGTDVLYVATPLTGPNGAVEGVVWATFDVTGTGGLLGRLTGFAGDASAAADLVSADGLVVASTNPTRIGQSIGVSTLVASALSATAPGSGAAGYADDQVFAGYAPLPVVPLAASDSSTLPAGGAVLLVYQPESAALAGLDNQSSYAALAVLVAIVLGAALAYLCYRMVVRPLREATAVLERAGAGDLSARVHAPATSEVAVLAAALNHTLDELSVAGHSPQERDQLHAQLATLLADVGEAARGDLTVEANVPTGALGTLADAFNYMVAELRRIITDVDATTNAVSTASSEIAARSGSVAQYSAGQAAQLAGATSAMTEMAMSIQHVSANARLSATVAREAETNARTGYDAVRVTMDGMERIRQQVQEASRIVARLGESSTEISSIVQLIAQIARQTNTLALNASIQAARAGEHGRGFAVVAEEVRKLAERSSSATKQISGLVTSIQAETTEAISAMEASMREVNDGSLVADQAGVALEQIDAVVVRMTELIDAISQMSEQQAATAEDISNAMRDMAELTATTSADTRDTAESADRLTRLADRLRRSVATFKLDSQAVAPLNWQGVNADGDD
jgi:methyl-accepting chemotaxis protein